MITLKVTDLQYELIKAAMQSYHSDMMRSLEPLEPEPTVQVSVSEHLKSIAPWLEDDAPWGRKKDGTPRAQPGRKRGQKSARKTRKARS